MEHIGRHWIPFNSQNPVNSLHNYIKWYLKKYIIFIPQMKRAFAILLLIIYTTASSGVSIRQFYCCGRLKSTTISFGQDAKEKCSKCNGKGRCCENKYHTLKIKDTHIAADSTNTPLKHFTDLHLFIPSFEVITLATELMDVANTSHAPPIYHGIPVYLLNCNFRI